MKENMAIKKKCGAYARTTGSPCNSKALNNGRCKLHGGMSTGPKSSEGKERVAKATKYRMLNGQLEASKKGYETWLKNGGKEHLSKVQRNRHRRSRLISMDFLIKPD